MKHLLRFLLYFAVLSAFGLAGFIAAEFARFMKPVWTAMSLHDYLTIGAVAFIVALVCTVIHAFEKE